MRPPRNRDDHSLPQETDAMVAEATSSLPPGWFDMEEAPKDGTLIQWGDTNQTARWRITRRRNYEEKKWEIVGFWSDPVTREPIIQELTMWRLPEGYLIPGMVV